jgi:vacuolar-type H+-ATPase subunit I/STV1
MRTLGTILVLIGCIGITADIVVGVVASYQYSKEYASYWELSVKASSIEKKIEGIDKFVHALDNAKLNGKHNALVLKTPDNSFDENLAALKSLQLRLHDISKMDIKSFEYQTALQQITQQEQNEAEGMLGELKDIWFLNNYFILWNWIGILQVLFFVAACLVGIGILGEV